MKTALLSVVLLALPAFVVGQPACQQATNQVIEHKLGFTIRSVTLRSAHGLVRATASIPDATKPSQATVFMFSTLVGSEPQESVDMMPVSVELTKQGLVTMVIERRLTWPDIDPSVGTMRADVTCAQQWLSKHATITPSNWIFVGPRSDVPDAAAGDDPRMTGWINVIVADAGSDVITEHLFHSTSDLRNFILLQHSLNQ